MNTVCYLCTSSRNEKVFLENGIPILKCTDCGHVFSSYEQDEHYAGYWQEEEFDLNWWDLAHREIYEEFIDKFMTKESGSILDVGCGLGFFVKMIGERKKDWRALGFEMSPQAVKFAREKNGLSNVYEGMVQKSGIAENSLDIITLWDVIEHIPKPAPLLDYLYSVLKPGGILFMQTPNFPIQLLKARIKVLLKGMREGVHYLEAKDHINDYSRESMKRLGRNSGFQDPEFHILKPILSVSGASSNAAVKAKLAYYYITKTLWKLSMRTVFLNNTLFAVYKK